MSTDTESAAPQRLAAFKATQEEVLRQQEAEDLATLLRETPVASDNGCMLWCFLRAPAPCEVNAASANMGVIVSATARGLRLRIDRNYVRRVDGEPISFDRAELSEQLRTGECVLAGPVPSSRTPPEIGLAVRVSLVLA